MGFFAALQQAITTFRREYFAVQPTRAGLDPGTFGLRDARALRYAFYWALYENTAYDAPSDSTTARAIHAFTASLKQQTGLYRFTRGVLNPAGRLGEFWATHTYQGQLDPLAGDGRQTPSSVPILDATDPARVALARLWADSNLASNLEILARLGAVKGDVFLAAHDPAAAGKACLEVVDPSAIVSVSKDRYGNVKGYVRAEARPDPDAGPVPLALAGAKLSPDVEYVETAERDGEDVVYRTYRDGQPYPWNGVAAEWRVPYGFVPLWHVQHLDCGHGWGLSEFHGGWVKFLESDDLGSKVNDQIRKAVDAIWTFSGARSSDVADAFAAMAASPAQRQALAYLCFQSEGARAAPLVAPVDIAAASDHVKMLVEQHLQDYPELRYELIRAAGDANAKALQEARKPAETKVRRRRGNYDHALVRAFQGAIAIAGLRANDPTLPAEYREAMADYRPFGLDSFRRGELDLRIDPDRPVFEVTEQDRAETSTLHATTAKAWADAGVPLAEALRLAGVPDDAIEAIVAAKEADAARAEAVRMRLMADAETMPHDTLAGGTGQ